MKIDGEKPYSHNFSEELKPQITKQDENSNADNKFSLDGNTPDEKNIYGYDIYDEKTITEIKIPDKVVISENIIKDVCIDERIKMDLNVKEKEITEESEDALKTKESEITEESEDALKTKEREITEESEDALKTKESEITEESEDALKTKEREITEESEDALKTMHDLKPTPDEKEIRIEEISDEKISLKELFHSEDQKLVEVDSSKEAQNTSHNKQTITQNTVENILETSTNGSETRQPDMPANLKNVSTNNIILEEVILHERPASTSVPSSSAPADEAPTSDTASRSVQPCDDGIEKHAHNSREIFYDGPKITARKSLSQSYGEINLPRSVLNSEPKGNSAHLAYSGSVSMRSDSSTTSARSFAFPILQSEWNSSPVKMAKADRRRFRRHGGWRSSIWCCGSQN